MWVHENITTPLDTIQYSNGSNDWIDSFESTEATELNKQRDSILKSLVQIWITDMF
jgi:hypothetical protein